MENAIIEMARAIRRAVRPHLGRAASKQTVGNTESGDAEFEIDEIAERAIDEFICKHDLQVAYYSEGRGLVTRGRPEHLLIIDPIDGTRPAMAGLEGGVVSIARAPYSAESCLADVTFGCILELKTDRLYTGARGGGVAIHEGERELPVDLRLITEIERMSWSYEFAGRPVELIAAVLGPMIDRSSITGGVFVINSTAFSLTRLVTGQLDAVVDVGKRILEDRPQLREHHVRAGRGSVIGLFPYDIAAAAVIAETAGCTVTNARGDSLGGTALLDTSEGNISSILAASNPVLHEKILVEIEAGIRRLS
ncbi:MAG: inositol monophosphatase family protein [Armatimonadota bacterium]